MSAPPKATLYEIMNAEKEISRDINETMFILYSSLIFLVNLDVFFIVIYFKNCLFKRSA